MNATTLAVGTSAIVVAGRWANGEQADIKLVVGLGAYAVCLSLAYAADPNIAGKLAAIVLFGALLKYLPSLVGKLGLSGGK